MPNTLTIPGIGHTLAATLRQKAAWTELAPQCALADGEFETAQTWSTGTAFGSWTLLNGANLLALDEHTTWKSKLYLSHVSTTGTHFFNAQTNAPLLYQSLTGDFDLQAAVSVGPVRDYASVGLLAVNPSTLTEHCDVTVQANDGGSNVTGNPNAVFSGASTHSSTTTYSTSSVGPKQWYMGGFIFVRLKRSGSTGTGGGTFSSYYSFDGKTWTLLRSDTRGTDMPQTLWVGPWMLTATAIANATALIEYVRNTLPYDMTSPSSSIVLDSGAGGTTWDPSTFTPNENPSAEFEPYSTIGFGTLKYQIGASDTNPPTLNGTWLSASGIQALGTLTGRYLKLAVQYNSAAGYDIARFGGATITATVTGGGGGPTYFSY